MQNGLCNSCKFIGSYSRYFIRKISQVNIISLVMFEYVTFCKLNVGTCTKISVFYCLRIRKRAGFDVPAAV